MTRFVLCSALGAVLCVASSSAANGQGRIGASNAQIVGGAVGIGAGIAAIFVAVAVIHGNHILNGCVMSGSNGPELKSSDAKTWSLEGDSANLTAGHRVKVHGARLSQKKNANGVEVFKVDKLVKDYGSCPG